MNLPDGYRCICSPGYQLHPSQAYCTGMHGGVLGSLSGWGQSPVSRQQKVQTVPCGR